jgi:uncharacterized protein (TIGR00369 family)
MPADAVSPADLVAAMPFAASLGIVLDAATPTEVRAQLPWSPTLRTAGGALHGGALMTLADSAAAICAYLNLPPDATTATLQSATNFLRAARSGPVRAISRPAHIGRTTIVIQTTLIDPEERHVALVTQTQSVLPPRTPAVT